MTSLTTLRNIGPQSARWLTEVDIPTAEQLYEIGAVESYQRVKTAFPDNVSINLLYALHGAIINIAWNKIPPEMKNDLQKQANIK